MEKLSVHVENSDYCNDLSVDIMAKACKIEKAIKHIWCSSV